MTDFIKQALTKRIRRGSRIIILKPNENLVLLVKFAIGMTVCLCAVEVACIVVLGQFSSEIFSTVTGLIGTVTGVLISHRA